MKTFQDKQKSSLIKKLHTMVRVADISRENYLDMLSGYGVESSKDLNVYELTELCSKVDYMINKDKYDDMNTWRKRVFAAIGGYLKKMNKESNADIIKAIACRAADCNNFNAIPIGKLRSVYNAFNNKSKVMDNVDMMMINATQQMGGVGGAMAN